MHRINEPKQTQIDCNKKRQSATCNSYNEIGFAPATDLGLQRESHERVNTLPQPWHVDCAMHFVLCSNTAGLYENKKKTALKHQIVEWSTEFAHDCASFFLRRSTSPHLWCRKVWTGCRRLVVVRFAWCVVPCLQVFSWTLQSILGLHTFFSLETKPMLSILSIPRQFRSYDVLRA